MLGPAKGVAARLALQTQFLPQNGVVVFGACGDGEAQTRRGGTPLSRGGAAGQRGGALRLPHGLLDGDLPDALLVTAVLALPAVPFAHPRPLPLASIT